MSRLLRSICTSESNLLRRKLMLRSAIINPFEHLSLVFLCFSKRSEINSYPKLTTYSNLIKMTPHFQKLPQLKLLWNYLCSSGFICLKLLNDFLILYYNYVEPNDFFCYYHDPISILTKTYRKYSQKTIFPYLFKYTLLSLT